MTENIHTVASHPHPLDQTPYLQREPLVGEDTPAVLTRAYLADVTVPVSVLDQLRANAHERHAPSYAYPGMVRMSAPLADVVERDAIHDLKILRSTPTMIGFRDRAQELSERYEQVAPKGYAAADSHFLGQAARLHGQMRAYTGDFLRYKSGGAVVEVNQPTEGVVSSVKQEVAKVLAMRRERDIAEPAETEKSGKFLGIIPRRSLQEVTIRLVDPEAAIEESEANRDWVEFYIDKKGKIQRVSLDERFITPWYCTDVDQLAAAHKAGATLTAAQMKLLESFDLAEPTLQSAGTVDIDMQPVIERLHEPSKEGRNVNPLHVFANSLNEAMSKWVKGKSSGHFYAQASSIEGPLQVNARMHDYADMQFMIELDTKSLSNDQVYELVAQYAAAIRAFPRVPRASRITNASSGSAQA
jgi:hypothetical protein